MHRRKDRPMDQGMRDGGEWNQAAALAFKFNAAREEILTLRAARATAKGMLSHLRSQLEAGRMPRARVIREIGKIIEELNR